MNVVDALLTLICLDKTAKELQGLGWATSVCKERFNEYMIAVAVMKRFHLVPQNLSAAVGLWLGKVTFVCVQHVWTASCTRLGDVLLDH